MKLLIFESHYVVQRAELQFSKSSKTDGMILKIKRVNGYLWCIRELKQLILKEQLIFLKNSLKSIAVVALGLYEIFLFLHFYHRFYPEGRRPLSL